MTVKMNYYMKEKLLELSTEMGSFAFWIFNISWCSDLLVPDGTKQNQKPIEYPKFRKNPEKSQLFFVWKGGTDIYSIAESQKIECGIKDSELWYKITRFLLGKKSERKE